MKKYVFILVIEIFSFYSVLHSMLSPRWKGKEKEECPLKKKGEEVLDPRTIKKHNNKRNNKNEEVEFAEVANSAGFIIGYVKMTVEKGNLIKYYIRDRGMNPIGIFNCICEMKEDAHEYSYAFHEMELAQRCAFFSMARRCLQEILGAQELIAQKKGEGAQREAEKTRAHEANHLHQFIEQVEIIIEQYKKENPKKKENSSKGIATVPRRNSFDSFLNYFFDKKRL